MRGKGFTLKEGSCEEEVLYCQGGEAQEQLAQRSCGWPIPTSQRQVRGGNLI